MTNVTVPLGTQYPNSARGRRFSDIAYDRMMYLFNHPGGDPSARPPLLPSVGSDYVDPRPGHGGHPEARVGNHVTDCITFVTDVLQYAFAQVGDAKSAAIVKQKPYVIAGMDLAKYLVGLGWRAYYWNPDPTFSVDRKAFVEDNAAFIEDPLFQRADDPQGNDPASVLQARHLHYDRAESYANEHTYSYNQVKRTGLYYHIKVEDAITGYRATPRGTSGRNVFGQPFPPEPSPSHVSMQKLSSFGSQVKFAYGATRGADHTFLFSNGNVFEVHWNRGPGDSNLFQSTPLWNWPWESGIIVVPGDTSVSLPPG